MNAILACAAISLWTCATADAYWGRNGVPLTAAIGWQGNHSIASDGAGGAIVAWQDERDFLVTDEDIYARRVSATGTLPSGWLPQGNPMCVETAYQAGPQIAPDGEGGAYVVWEDRRSGVDLFLQRVTADGANAPGWPVNGIPVCQAPRFQVVPRLVPDDEGGVFVVWEDFRTDGLNSDLYAQRITPQGQLAPGWPVDGLPVCSGLIGWRVFRTISDGQGGFFVAWSDGRNDAVTMADIYAQHMLADGSVAPGWPVNGLAICTAPRHQAHTELALDGDGGLYVAWNDARYGPPEKYFENHWDLFAQRVQADGTIAAGWPADGLPVCMAYSAQYSHSIAADGQGGAILAWVDFRDHEPNASDLYSQRVLPTGEVAWATDGVPLSRHPDFQRLPTVIADGAGGALVAFQTGGGDDQVFAQRVLEDGTIPLGWAADGFPLCDFIGQRYPVATTDGQGGLIVAWEDERGGIWAQQVSPDYPTTTLASFAGSVVEPGRVVLTWLAGPTVAASARVFRRHETSDWVSLGAPRHEDRDRLVFEDDALSPGRYAYRLGYTTAAGEAFTPEEWVTVPSGPTLALAGFQPNPVRGTPSVSLSLASSEGAALQVFDAAGRVLIERQVGTLGAGRHLVPLERAHWQPGLYWVRLTQGAGTLIAKGMVVR